MLRWFLCKDQAMINKQWAKDSGKVLLPVFVIKSTGNMTCLFLIFLGALTGASTLVQACSINASQELKLAVGGSATFDVTCFSFCLATDTITATSNDAGAQSTVTPATRPSNASPQTFTVTRVASGITSIDVAWQCSGSTGGFSVPITEGVVKTQEDCEPNCGSDLEPISTFSGELFNQYAPDINLGGMMPLLFSRYYASGLKIANITGALGDNWRHNHEWKLTSTTTIATITSPQGRSITFARFKPTLFDPWKLVDRNNIAYQLAQNATFVGGLPVAGNFILADPRSNRTYTFNPAGLLLSISDTFGNTHTLTHNAAGQLTQVSDGLGRALNFTYNAAAKLISVNDGLGRSISFAYTASDLTGVTDPLGNTTSFTYAAGGLMTGTIRPAGNTTFRQTWNAARQVLTQTDALGNTQSIGYIGANTTVTNPLAKTMTHTHTATGELSNLARRNGSSLAMTYNTTGQRNSIADSLGANTLIGYDAASGRVISTTHANGATTSKTFSTRTRGPRRHTVNLFDTNLVTHSDGTVESFVFNIFGSLDSYTDRAGNTTTYSRTLTGQWQSLTNPTGGGQVRTYNADGTVATDKLAFKGLGFTIGNTTSFAYDAFRRLSTITFADASARAFTYDLMDRPLTVTDNRGNVTSMAYDANGNLISSTDRTGAITTTAYDTMDRISRVTYVNAAFSTRSYDALGHLASTVDRNGNINSFGYDTQNRLTSVTDGNGNTSSRTFDMEGVLASSSTPLGHTTHFTSNNMGRITRVSSPLGHTTLTAYDLMNRPISTTDPLGNVSASTYGPNGLIAQRTLPGPITASYVRNGLNRITQITDPNGNNWLHSFDRVGRMAASTDPLTRASTFTYDNRNRVNLVTFPGGLGTRTNTYDGNGNLTQRLYSDGTTLNFTFDAEDRLLTANGLALTRDNLGRITGSNGMTMTYDAGSRITSITYAAGKAVTYTYDANNNVKTITDWLGGISTFTYDADNRLISMTRPNGVTATYAYNNDGRLVGFVDGALGATTLTRNAKGQITAANSTVSTAASAVTMSNTTHTFDIAAQVSTVGFTYDAMGRQTNNGATAFTWDLASRLSSAGLATHTYDGIGYRLSRTTAAAGTRNYMWNMALGLPTVSIEKQGAADLRYYVHSPGGLLIYSIDAVGNARHFYHFDETGNTRFVSNDTGVVEASYTYSPFGVLQAKTGVLDNPFTWQGQLGIFDDSNGLYYIRARYYDASTGRFISKDPVKSIAPKQVNPYQFALNNPLTFHDTQGTKPGAEIMRKLNTQFGVKKMSNKIIRERQKLIQDIKRKCIKSLTASQKQTILNPANGPGALVGIIAATCEVYDKDRAQVVNLLDGTVVMIFEFSSLFDPQTGFIINPAPGLPLLPKPATDLPIVLVGDCTEDGDMTCEGSTSASASICSEGVGMTCVDVGSTITDTCAEGGDMTCSGSVPSDADTCVEDGGRSCEGSFRDYSGKIDNGLN